nr:serine/arginine repetitive matrix protein 1-like [Aegilops tauschii subsp. strangulata]XP_040243751.1 serine/arginine repetitive matrix protein 1-like [Aegilops tauschii subsp. strangulata]
MRARLHSRPLLLVLLPPCYCGSAEHPTMPALQLALGHTRVLVMPAARARLLPQPSQLQPLMHTGLLSLRAPTPVLARPHSAGSSASSNACRVVLAHRLPCLPGRPDTPAPAPAGPSSRLGRSAIDHAGRRARPPGLHASRPPCAEAGCSVRSPASPWAGCCSAPASPSASALLYYARRLPSSASRRRRRLASLPTSSRRLLPAGCSAPGPLHRLRLPATRPAAPPPAFSANPDGRLGRLRLLHEQRRLAHSAGPPPRATSQDRLRLLRRAASSHRLGRARACPTSSLAASASPVPPRAQLGPVSTASTCDRVASCAPPRWLRPARASLCRLVPARPPAARAGSPRSLPAGSLPTRTTGSAACRLRRNPAAGFAATRPPTAAVPLLPTGEKERADCPTREAKTKKRGRGAG